MGVAKFYNNFWGRPAPRLIFGALITSIIAALIISIVQPLNDWFGVEKYNLNPYFLEIWLILFVGSLLFRNFYRDDHVEICQNNLTFINKFGRFSLSPQDIVSLSFVSGLASGKDALNTTVNEGKELVDNLYIGLAMAIHEQADFLTITFKNARFTASKKKYRNFWPKDNQLVICIDDFRSKKKVQEILKEHGFVVTHDRTAPRRIYSSPPVDNTQQIIEQTSGPLPMAGKLLFIALIVIIGPVLLYVLYLMISNLGTLF